MRKSSFSLFTSKIIIGCSIFSSLFFTSVPYIYAGEITNANDTLTRQKQGVASQHTIDLRLANGFDFDASGGKDVLAIQFPTTFSISGTWTTGDMTFWQDQTGSSAGTLTQVTVAQVVSGASTSTDSLTCSQNSQVGIAIDTTNLIFRIQPCTTTYTASDTGGTNIGAMRLIILTDSANGELTNPASAANSVSVAVFHDDEGVSKKHSSEFRLSIVSNDQISATSTIGPTFTFALTQDSGSADTCNSTSQSSVMSILWQPLSASIINDSTSTICTYAFTNSGNSGTKISVYGWSANGGLYHTTSTAYLAGSQYTTTTLKAGTNFAIGTIADVGLCVLGGADTGTITATSPFNGTCTKDSGSGTAGGGALTTSVTSIWTSSSGTAATHILPRISIKNDTPAGTYVDTWYFVATGTF